MDLGRHPSQKTEPMELWVIAHSCRKLNKKGMIPIAKNIIVVDEQGNEYEATYPKRAKGLVKNGRARFVSENKICLACPPNLELEDNDMSENKDTQLFSADYILKQIEKIQEQFLDLKNTVNNIGCVEECDRIGEEETTVHDEVAIKKIIAITEVFHRREESLQKLLELYSKMYDDLRPKELSDDILKLKQLTDTLCRYPNEFAEDVIRKASQQMFVKAGAEVVK